MSFLTERVMAKMQKYLEDKAQGRELSDEEMQALLNEFMQQHNAMAQARPLTSETAETAMDFLELADRAPSEKKRLQLIDKALELEPDNIDAQLIKLQHGKLSPWEKLRETKNLLDKARHRLEEDGYFSKDCIGRFWGIQETRPFMRAYCSYVYHLFNDGQMYRAMQGATEMLKLCQDDNLGVRYMLAHIYAHFEDEKGMNKLYKKYPEPNSVHFALPQSLLQYRLGNDAEALKWLRQIYDANPDIKKFFTKYFRSPLSYYIEPRRGYLFGTIEEFEDCVSAYEIVYGNTPSFFMWCREQVKSFKKATAKKSVKGKSKK